jgi:hypothetical protein
MVSKAANDVQTTDWKYDDWRFRLPIQVHVAGYDRYDKPVEAPLDFGWLRQASGTHGPAGACSIRLVEVNSQGAVLDDTIPFQFDPGGDDDASTGTQGMLIFVLKGTTRAEEIRYFYMYFDPAGTTAAGPAIPAQVSVTDNVYHEGQESFKVVTRNATYYYHKQGAGFASMEDSDGNDWIGFHPSGGSAGNYRGIPNLVHPEGYFHPGNTGLTSTIVHQGPLKLTLRSESNDGQWACTWEIYPFYARLTVLKRANAYWFLYEGTPGGELDLERDYIVRSTGQRTPALESWEGDIPEPEWLYFGAGNTPRVLYVIHHEDDDAIDSYWPMNGEMTVFGFGRKGLGKFLEAVPAHFTIGFAEDGDFTIASSTINSAYKDLSITFGEPEAHAQAVRA